MPEIAVDSKVPTTLPAGFDDRVARISAAWRWNYKCFVWTSCDESQMSLPAVHLFVADSTRADMQQIWHEFPAC